MKASGVGLLERRAPSAIERVLDRYVNGVATDEHRWRSAGSRLKWIRGQCLALITAEFVRQETSSLRI